MKFKFCLIVIYLFGFGSGASPKDSAVSYTLVNLQKNFEGFWKLASQKSLDEKITLWNQLIEAPHQSFYDSLVWSKATTPDWATRKKDRLKDLFEEYPKLYPQIINNFSHFQKTLDSQIKKFQLEVPEAQFNLPIYAVAAATFNGKAGDGGVKNISNPTILAFGMDVMAERHDNPDVLYSHELFHIYHSHILKMTPRDYAQTAHLTLPLWLEGLATFVSGKFNSTATESEILMDADLAALSPKKITWLAKEFLKVAQNPAQDGKDPITYLKWFSLGEYKLNRFLPGRCGYRLGLEVVRRLSKTYSIPEMSHWQLGELNTKVLETLNTIATET